MFKSLCIAFAGLLAAAGGVQAQEALPRTPEEVLLAFERHFNAADLDGLATLYGKDSLFVAAPGVPLREPARIREALAQFLAPGWPIRLNLRHVYPTADTALVVVDWVLENSGEGGPRVEMAGTGTDVVIRQADGTWIYAIDNPFGVATPPAQ